MRISLARKIVFPRCPRRTSFPIPDFSPTLCTAMMDALNLCLNLHSDGVVPTSGEFSSMRARMTSTESTSALSRIDSLK